MYPLLRTDASDVTVVNIVKTGLGPVCCFSFEVVVLFKGRELLFWPVSVHLCQYHERKEKKESEA